MTYSKELIAKVKDLSDKFHALKEQALRGKDPDNITLFLKIVTPLVVNVENTLPDLRDLVDTLEYQQDPLSDELRKLADSLEDSLMTILPYLDKLRKDSGENSVIHHNSNTVQ